MKPLAIFNVLVAYIFIQFCWWASLLIGLQPQKWLMIAGEGVVFLFLLGFGAYKLRKAIHREVALNRQQKNFLLSVTHEFKSPLSSVKLSLETMLRRKLDPEKQAQLLNNSLQDVERLDELVENMLIATRIENRSYTYYRELLDLPGIIRHITAKYAQHRQHIHVETDEHIRIHADPVALTSVILNLVDNAIKYSASEAPIYVRLYKEQGQPVLEIEDQGPGIPETEKSMIFRKFYRIGNEETRKAKGTGLGLYIVKQVLDEHGATIRVLNNQPAGTIFKIYFPA